MSFELSKKDKKMIYNKYKQLRLWINHDQTVYSLTRRRDVGLNIATINEVLLGFGVSRNESLYYSSKIYCYISDVDGLGSYSYIIYLKRDIVINGFIRDSIDELLTYPDCIDKFISANPNNKYFFEIYTDRQDGEAIIKLLIDNGFSFFDLLGLSYPT